MKVGSGSGKFTTRKTLEGKQVKRASETTVNLTS